jgi:micrococcal nuclease
MAEVKDPKGFVLIASIASAILVIAFVVDLLGTSGITFQLPIIDTTTNTSTAKEYVKVTRVIDGDTITVDMNGNKENVRLIGINTPELNPSNGKTCYGEEAAKRTRSLVEGDLISLEYDDSQPLRDVYNRLLAYVYLEDGEMLNRKLLAEGYAYEYTYLVPYKYQEEFRELVDFAKRSGRGLWGENACSNQ